MNLINVDELHFSRFRIVLQQELALISLVAAHLVNLRIKYAHEVSCTFMAEVRFCCDTSYEGPTSLNQT